MKICVPKPKYTICAKVYLADHDASFAKFGSFFSNCGAKEDSIELILVKLNSANNKENLDIFLQVLTLIFNPDNVFNNKNSLRIANEEIEKKYTNRSESLNGWLIDFINFFGNSNGFDSLINLIQISNDLNELNWLLKPIAVCANFLNEKVMKELLESGFKRLIDQISALESEHFKDSAGTFKFVAVLFANVKRLVGSSLCDFRSKNLIFF